MNNLIKLFNYKGNEVAFRNHNGVVYVNATEMSKPFGKLPKDYLKSQQANELLEAISKRTNLLLGDIVKVVKGGNASGTWMHEDIAIDFAQWLSINFRLWCNDRIKELITVGLTATPETLENMLTNPDLLIGLATQLKEERAEKERLLEENQLTQQIIAIQQPKVDYVKAVLQSNSFRTVNEIATDLGMTANKLNATLHAHQIQYKQGGIWMLYAKYRSCGYAFSRTDLKNGHTYTQLVWTEKGRAFIHALLNPVMIQSIQTKNSQVNLLQN
jgi:phage antirepressor YoqD-like protein